MEEMTVGPNSEFVGLSLMASQIRQKFDLILIVIRKPDDTMLFNPQADTILENGDTMVVVGSAKSLIEIKRVM